MSLSKTPRILLTKESDDELIDPFAVNWPILDTFAGGVWVANGSTPVGVYDGMIVNEATSGISWIADLSSGSLVKQWLTYPWLASATKAAWAQGSSYGTGIPVPLDTPEGNGVTSYNWDKVLVNNQIKLPIAGIYSMTGTLRDMHQAAQGRMVGITWQGGNMSTQNNIIMDATPGWTYIQTCWIAPLSQDGLVGMDSWQSASAPGNADFTLTVELVNPLW
jgi:hypothetical protein